ncbi:hypothetical protein P8610_08635 [Fictibacillus sp. UD]|uniref:hypothetical protein n=1 Tax=Fictibacillus sp. UD TaxID=3038777 RepID=UPI0037462BFB
MKETLERIWKRFRKLAILLILLPLLTAGAAYLFQKEGPASYTASADIQLARFGKEVVELDFTDFSDAEYAKIYMTSDDFIKNIKTENKDIDPEELKANISFVIKAAKVLSISYTGDTPEETEKTLKLVIDQYINESIDKKDDLAKILEKAKSQASDSDKTASDYDLIISGLREVTVLKDVQLDQVEESTKNNVAFGFLIGLILSFMILLLPEVFIKE